MNEFQIHVVKEIGSCPHPWVQLPSAMMAAQRPRARLGTIKPLLHLWSHPKAVLRREVHARAQRAN